jgi:archaellum component FlaD/FlaE
MNANCEQITTCYTSQLSSRLEKLEKRYRKEIEKEKQRTAEEKQRTEEEKQRTEEEKQRTEEEKQRVAEAKQRVVKAEQQADWLRDTLYETCKRLRNGEHGILDGKCISFILCLPFH